MSIRVSRTDAYRSMIRSVAACLCLVATSGLVQERQPAPEKSVASEETYVVPIEVLVVDGNKIPLAGVTLAFGVRLAGDAPRYVDRPILAHATSDERGLVRYDVPVPVRWKKEEKPYLWARVGAPDRPSRVVHRLLATVPKQPLKLRTSRGGTVAGRVLGPEGKPVVGARVGLFRQTEDGVRGHSRETDSEGRFALDFIQSESEFWLHARARGLGSAQRKGLKLEPGMDVAAAGLDRLELRLGGGSSLGGRVVDAAGEPVAGVGIVALADPYEDFPYLDGCSLAESEGGLVGDVARTDLDGTFCFPALIDGEFRLFGQLGSSPSGDAVGTKAKLLGPLLTRRRFSPGSLGREALIELASMRLEISIVDHKGRWLDRMPQFRRLWKDDLEESVLDVIRLNDTFFHSARLDPVFVDGRIMIDLDRPGEYVVCWRQPGVPYVEQRVVVEPGMLRVPVRIPLPEPEGNARITVEVNGPDGKPHVGPKQIHLYSPSGWLVATTVVHTGFGNILYKEPTWTASVPPGSYRVVAAVEPSWACVLPDPLPRAEYAPAAEDTQLRAGDDHVVSLQLVAAGHLDLDVVVARDVPALEEVLAILAGDSMPPDERLAEHYGGHRVQLVPRDGGETLQLEFETPALHIAATRLPYVFAGWTARTRTPIPAGYYRLEIGSSDGEPFVRQVEIRAGEVTEIVW